MPESQCEAALRGGKTSFWIWIVLFESQQTATVLTGIGTEREGWRGWLRRYAEIYNAADQYTHIHIHIHVYVWLKKIKINGKEAVRREVRRRMEHRERGLKKKKRGMRRKKGWKNMFQGFKRECDGVGNFRPRCFSLNLDATNTKNPTSVNSQLKKLLPSVNKNSTVKSFFSFVTVCYKLDILWVSVAYPCV